MATHAKAAGDSTVKFYRHNKIMASVYLPYAERKLGVALPGFINISVYSESKKSGRARLLVGQASAARMLPSNLHGSIHGVLSGERPCLATPTFIGLGNCQAFMYVTVGKNIPRDFKVKDVAGFAAKWAIGQTEVLSAMHLPVGLMCADKTLPDYKDA